MEGTTLKLLLHFFQKNKNYMPRFVVNLNLADGNKPSFSHSSGKKIQSYLLSNSLVKKWTTPNFLKFKLQRIWITDRTEDYRHIDMSSVRLKLFYGKPVIVYYSPSYHINSIILS